MAELFSFICVTLYHINGRVVCLLIYVMLYDILLEFQYVVHHYVEQLS